MSVVSILDIYNNAVLRKKEIKEYEQEKREKELQVISEKLLESITSSSKHLADQAYKAYRLGIPINSFKNKNDQKEFKVLQDKLNKNLAEYMIQIKIFENDEKDMESRKIRTMSPEYTWTIEVNMIYDDNNSDIVKRTFGSFIIFNDPNMENVDVFWADYFE